MNSSFLILACAGFLVLGYVFYGKFLSRFWGLDPQRTTPAYQRNDGVDFVPARHWLILFGHHFSSICGAGPIVGPVIAVAYWGWGVSLVWILLGSVFLGAVADFSSLVVSVRSRGDSIASVAKDVISPRARLMFIVFIWLSLILVIAVFAILAAKTFSAQKDIVLPSVGIIPLAVFFGWLLYAKKGPMGPLTVGALSALAALLYFGSGVEIALSSNEGLNVNLWILLLLVYCFIASVLPVQFLLQPRDYLSGFVLFAAIGLGTVGAVFSAKGMQGPGFLGWTPDPSLWPAAGPLWPMLFVTIACGAISGFHSLVSSGTTCKQLAKETHACRIGYGGMLTEGFVACLVVFCVAAGLSRLELTGFVSGRVAGGPIAAFGSGFGALTQPFLGDLGKVFAIMALNAFILTTLDSATRIGRYLTAELFGIDNRYLSTGLVVFLSGALALTGQWQRIWPVFGASNQLVAALALLVASCWLLSKGKPTLVTLIPSALMAVTTIGAFAFQMSSSLRAVDASGQASPQWTAFILGGVLTVLSLAVFWEGFKTYRRVLAK